MQFGTIGLAIIGEQLAGVLSINIPAHYLAALREKRMMLIIGIWFAGSMIHNALMSTGAFEVFYDGKLVFSKLASGTMPNLNEIMAGIDSIRSATQR